MASPTYVLGIDSSTQSCKSLLVDADTGEVVATGRAPHPDGTEIDPALWRTAMTQSCGDLLPRASAVAVGGQQHGIVSTSTVKSCETPSCGTTRRRRRRPSTSSPR